MRNVERGAPCQYRRHCAGRSPTRAWRFASEFVRYNYRKAVMAGPDPFYNLFSPGWRSPVTSIRPRIVRTDCVRRIDNQTAIFFDSQLYFAERHNAGVHLTSESGNKDDSEAGARDSCYKKFQLYHVNLKYFPGRLDYYLAHHALCVGRHLISETIEKPIRWY